MLAATNFVIGNIATYSVAADPATVLSGAPTNSECAEHSMALFPGGAWLVLCGSSGNVGRELVNVVHRRFGSE